MGNSLHIKLLFLRVVFSRFGKLFQINATNVRDKQLMEDILVNTIWPSSKVIYVRDMAALTGLIISTAPAVGRRVRFYTRASDGCGRS